MTPNLQRFDRLRSRDIYADRVIDFVNNRGEYNTNVAECLVVDGDIYDVTSSGQGARARHKPRPCYHTQVEFMDFRKGPLTVAWWWGGEWFTMSQASLNLSRDKVQQLATWSPLLRGYSEDDLARTAWDRFSTQVPETLSIGNFLLEWGEVEELIGNFTLHSLQHKSGHSLLNEAGSQYLGYSFGISPLIGDLEALLSLVKRVTARIEWLKAHNHKRTRLSFRRSDLAQLPAIPPEVDVTGPLLRPLGNKYFNYTAKARLVSVDDVFTATGYLVCDLEGLDDIWAVVRGIVADLGLNNPLGVLYNAIPFSFVLDWMFKLSRVLESTRARPYQGTYRCDNFTSSLKRENVWEVTSYYQGLNPPTWGSLPLSRSEGIITSSVYDRSTSIPGLFPVFTFPPTAGQALLTAALLT